LLSSSASWYSLRSYNEFDPIEDTERTKDSAGSERGAAYVYERNQGGADHWGEVKKLTASDAQNYDYFGYAVTISGDTVVVGACVEDGVGSNRGAAYVFVQPVYIYLPFVLKNSP